jgi:hypothetical protein
MSWLFTAVGTLLAIVFGNIYGLGLGLLVFGGTVLVGSVFLFWNSLNSLTADTPLTLEDALSLGAPSAEEEQKRAVLRALKDLEYERDIGKINAADYAQLAERYRAEAKVLLQRLDRDLESERQRGEQLLAQRLKQFELNPKTESPSPDRTHNEAT